MKDEIFKPVEGFEDCYAISNTGIVVNTRTGLELRPATGSSGYAFIVLHNRGFKKTLRVNRLVAIAFIPNPDNKPSVNHKDCDKLNNNVDNLEWVTFAENIQHAYANKRITNVGENANLAVINRATAEKVLEMHLNGLRNCDIIKELGLTKSIVSKIVRGITWKELHE